MPERSCQDILRAAKRTSTDRPKHRGLKRALLAFGMAFGVFSAAEAAESFPSKTIRIVGAYAAASDNDNVVRIVAEKLQQILQQTVVIDPKPGATGMIAAAEVARSPADGYTLLSAAIPTVSIIPHAYAKMALNPLTDLAPVAELTNTDLVLVTSVKTPAKDLGGFVEWAKKQPAYFHGTVGAGSLGHFGGVMFTRAVGIENPEYVHYRDADIATSVVNGDAQSFVLGSSQALRFVNAGQAVALATSGPERSRAFPDVPTFKESGYPDLVFVSWHGLFAPANTPPEIVGRLNTAIQEALKDPETKGKLEALGHKVSTISTTDAFSKMISADSERWKTIVQASGFKID